MDGGGWGNGFNEGYEKILAERFQSVIIRDFTQKVLFPCLEHQKKSCLHNKEWSKIEHASAQSNS
jgi:hypothetical protein